MKIKLLLSTFRIPFALIVVFIGMLSFTHVKTQNNRDIEAGEGFGSIKLGCRCLKSMKKQYGYSFEKKKYIVYGRTDKQGFRSTIATFNYKDLGIKFSFQKTTLTKEGEKNFFLHEIEFYGLYAGTTKEKVFIGSKFDFVVKQYGDKEWEIINENDDFILSKSYLGIRFLSKNFERNDFADVSKMEQPMLDSIFNDIKVDRIIIN